MLTKGMRNPFRGGGICSASRAYPLEGVNKAEVETALGYFEANAPRMRYHWFRRCGLFLGSAVVEASCKSVIGQRFKQSGMHWTVNGADAIATLRCQQARRPQDQIWPAPRNQTPAAWQATSQARATRPASYRSVTYKSGARPWAARRTGIVGARE
jgi:hypothetical protein